jgi:hypothetical protein
MAIVARINTTGSIGRATIKSSPKTTIAADTIEPKPNVSMGEINDVSLSGLQNGYTLIFNASTNNFESQPISNVSITNIIGGFF